MKGLRFDIMHMNGGATDCTNGGVSATVSQGTLVGIGCEVFDVEDYAPAFRLVERNIRGSVYRHLEPVNVPAKAWLMAGGNFGWTSDSRFPNDYPLSIHDRIE